MTGEVGEQKGGAGDRWSETDKKQKNNNYL